MQSGEQKGGGNVITELLFLRNWTTWLNKTITLMTVFEWPFMFFQQLLGSFLFLSLKQWDKYFPK